MTARFDRFSGGPQNGRAFNHGVVASEGGTMYVTGQVAWTAKVAHRRRKLRDAAAPMLP